MLGPRVSRTRVRARCDDDCPQPCPSPWSSPAVVAVVTAAATALFNALGEVWVESRKAQLEAARPQSAPAEEKPSRKRGGA